MIGRDGVKFAPRNPIERRTYLGRLCALRLNRPRQLVRFGALHCHGAGRERASYRARRSWLPSVRLPVPRARSCKLKQLARPREDSIQPIPWRAPEIKHGQSAGSFRAGHMSRKRAHFAGVRCAARRSASLTRWRLVGRRLELQ